jgi:choline dehydrogenase-like flavoprotein
LQYDLIVVGAGMAAGPVIHRLCGAYPELRGLVIEKGHGGSGLTPAARPAADQTLELVSGGRSQSCARWWEGTAAGGGSNLWYGQLSRFRPNDLTLDGAIWPFDCDELNSCYDKIERLLQPYGYDLPGAPRDCQIFRSRSQISDFERAIADAFLHAGLTPSIVTTCLGGPAWNAEPVDPLDLRTIHPEQFDAVRPTFASLNQRAVEASAWQVKTACEVTGLVTQGGRVTGVRFRDSSGNQGSASAPVVVLAAGPLRTVPLLMTLPFPPDGTGDDFGFSLQGTAYLRTSIPRSEASDDLVAGRFAAVALRDLGDLSPALRGLGKMTLYDAFAFDGQSKTCNRLQAHCLDADNAIASAERSYLIKASFKGTSPNAPSKRILGRGRNGTDGTRLQYEATQEDHTHAAAIRELFEALAGIFPGGELLYCMAPDDPNWFSAHQHGGARYNSSTGGAVDAFGEVAGYRGLHIADSSYFPGSGSTNISHTIMAGALRIAEHIAKEQFGS